MRDTEQDENFTSTMFMKCNKNSWASCCRLVENSGWPRPTSALNIRGAIPIWSPCKHAWKDWLQEKIPNECTNICYNTYLQIHCKYVSSYSGFGCAVFLSRVWSWFGILSWQEAVSKFCSVVNKQKLILVQKYSSASQRDRLLAVR